MHHLFKISHPSFPSQVLQRYHGLCTQVRASITFKTKYSSSTAADPNSAESLGSAEECLSEMTGLFHPDHHLYMKLARICFEQQIDRGVNYELAREYGLLCLNSYRKYKVRKLSGQSGNI